jgi:hypothetical protein
MHNGCNCRLTYRKPERRLTGIFSANSRSTWVTASTKEYGLVPIRQSSTFAESATIGAEQWTHEVHVPQTIEGAFAQGAKEMIVVLPDSKMVHNGSMYSSSATTGDLEQFIAHDLVAYIDPHYRTIPNRLSRGLNHVMLFFSQNLCFQPSCK